MNTNILERIWNDNDYCFTPIIHGWGTATSGKPTSVKYMEGTGHDKDSAIQLVQDMSSRPEQLDLYFCPVQFKAAKRLKSEVTDTLNILWADLDEADPTKIDPRPTIAWHSSNNHYQALWLLSDSLPAQEIEQLNKQLTYAIKADKSGWDISQILRVPGSMNYKYKPPEPCKLLWEDGKVYTSTEIKSILSATNHSELVAPISSLPDITRIAKQFNLSSRAVSLLNATEAPVGERSDRLWELEKLFIEAGMPINMIVDILRTSIWNKFAGRKDGDRQLLQETLKAEAEYKAQQISVTIQPGKVVTTDDFNMLTCKEFMDLNIPAPTFLIEGFVQVSSVGMCAGEPKTMKSTMLLDMAISVASNTKFLGTYDVKQCPVLYIQKENSAGDIQRRVKYMYKAKGIQPTDNIPLYIVNNPNINLQDIEHRDFLDKILVDKGIKFLILDPWYMLCGEIDEDKSKDITPILKYLTSIRDRFGCAVMLIHHFRKSEASRGGQRMRGSSAFHAWVECGLYTALNKGIHGNIVVEREFRSEPSTRGLNLIFSIDNTSMSYYVQVNDYSFNSSTKSLPINVSAEEADEEEKDNGLMTLSEEDPKL